MKFEDCIKSYFLKNIEEWDHKTFAKCMEFIGYKDDDKINRIFLKFVKEFVRKEKDIGKKQMAMRILKDFQKAIRKVNI